MRVRATKAAVWLLTGVRDRQRLSAAPVAPSARGRRQDEGQCRTDQRALAPCARTARAVALVHREAEVALLAQGVRGRRAGGRRVAQTGSGRGARRAWRGALTLTRGSCLGPRPQRR